MSTDGLDQCRAKMRHGGVDKTAINVFSYYYRKLRDGETGLIDESSIRPLRNVTHYDNIEAHDDEARQALSKTVAIKLNGGLGTSMGMDQAKSLLPVRDGHTFFDIICRQILSLRDRYGVDLPLVFMNSFATQADTEAALQRYPDIPIAGIPTTFMQNREPKISADTLAPISWPDNPKLEWCPPGHGDIYPALMSSQILSTLLDAGFRYAMVSNSDNVGATVDPHIATWFAHSGSPFCVEVCRRTHADRKGGHLAVDDASGQIILREAAQTAPDDMSAFMDIERHHFFNTNNLWFDLRVLHDYLEDNEGVLGLPMIRNLKTVDPTDPDTPSVIQLETAMGSAVGVFPNATAIEVPRRRFLPVKTTDDLLLVSSDVYSMDNTYRVRPVIDQAPLITLDKRFYKNINDFLSRFPDGPPSLVNATSLTVNGNVVFGSDVVCTGDVVITAPSADNDTNMPDESSRRYNVGSNMVISGTLTVS